MTRPFHELTELARARGGRNIELPRQECLEATRAFLEEQREEVRRRHVEGESGANVVRALSESMDEVLRGVFRFAFASQTGTGNSTGPLMTRMAVCALGGYGRMELSPCSDVDVCLLYEGDADERIQLINDYVIPFLWDAGLTAGYAIRNVEDTIELAKEDLTVFTSFLEGRLVLGDSTVFARMRLFIRELQATELAGAFVRQKARDRYEDIPPQYRDLYAAEPDLKENAGGLRDFHTALWLLMMAYGANTLDEAVAQELITSEEQLDFVQGLDFIWRVRNELHFRAGRPEDRLTYANQKHVAQAFGFGKEDDQGIAGLMADYYAAAGKVRRFLRISAGICHYPVSASPGEGPEAGENPAWLVEDGLLYPNSRDPDQFAHNPARMMEVFWRCARHKADLCRWLERLVADNLHLVTDTFRSNDLVRRYLVALCNRPLDAGFALRRMARVGLLGEYMPEFQAVAGIIRYANFHTYPVDEHTLRAVESLSRIPEMEGPVGRGLQEALEHLSDPYVLVLAILMHDFGKASGETHVEESTRITRDICERIGISEDGAEQIAFLVEQHVLMNHISQYRDLEDEDIVRSFCDTVQTEQRLRALFLLSYADLSAVGPTVWTEWKGALLLRLYLKAMGRLVGRTESIGEEYWASDKAKKVYALMPANARDEAREHIKSLGQRYLLAFPPEEVVSHLECVSEALDTGLAVRARASAHSGMTELVVSTRDKHGLFSMLAGCFSSQLIDVNRAALFTRPDGWVVDAFTVADAWQKRALTDAQVAVLEGVMRSVLLEKEDVGSLVDRARRSLFALPQARIPIPTRVDFDNRSSRDQTVVDLETGDRTGLLYDITRAMAEAGLDISAARIVTDVRRARDAFYVTKGGTKIPEGQAQSEVRKALMAAIHPRAADPNDGDAAV